MKKIFFILIVFFLALSPVKVFASTESDVFQRVDSDIIILNNFQTSIQDEEDPEIMIETFLREIPAVKQQLSESSTFYEAIIATETDEELKTVITKINDDTKALQSDLITIEDAINTGDVDLYSKALTSYDNNISSLNSHVQELNSTVGGADYSWLFWPFILSLVISASLFVMSRGNPILPAEQLRNKFEFELFKSSLWPLIGSSISYFWYLFTPPGGTFYIFYWPILIGFFVFFKGLYVYVTQARPAINLAKNEQKTKLQALISSDKFQNESVQEEVKDVVNLSNEKRIC